MSNGFLLRLEDLIREVQQTHILQNKITFPATFRS